MGDLPIFKVEKSTAIFQNLKVSMEKINTGDLPLPGTELPAGSCQNPCLPSLTQNVTLQFSRGFPKKLVWWHQGVPSKSKCIMYHWLCTVPISPSYPGYIYPPVIKCGNGENPSFLVREFPAMLDYQRVTIIPWKSHMKTLSLGIPMGIPMGNPHPAIMNHHETRHGPCARRPVNLGSGWENTNDYGSCCHGQMGFTMGYAYSIL